MKFLSLNLALAFVSMTNLSTVSSAVVYVTEVAAPVVVYETVYQYADGGGIPDNSRQQQKQQQQQQQQPQQQQPQQQQPQQQQPQQQQPQQQQPQQSQQSQDTAGLSSDDDLMLSQINNRRAQSGLRPLSIDQSLMRVAYDHSVYQASIGRMTHDSIYPDLIARFAASGATCSACSENVGSGMTDVTQANNAWFSSPGHLANILGDYNHIGWSNVNSFWTQVFNV
ncbi:hypothetical protein AYI70_g10408 [Smittium culicis]|uniref:SCP domain-containing protein n=1 Tax=Smittium culicis TaxID=133412 RepID=A0A1R1X6P6_9FUNG|nr:hypothetical protein AYI70_g10408 [Smittium culicis]